MGFVSSGRFSLSNRSSECLAGDIEVVFSLLGTRNRPGLFGSLNNRLCRAPIESQKRYTESRGLLPAVVDTLAVSIIELLELIIDFGAIDVVPYVLSAAARKNTSLLTFL